MEDRRGFLFNGSRFNNELSTPRLAEEQESTDGPPAGIITASTSVARLISEAERAVHTGDLGAFDPATSGWWGGTNPRVPEGEVRARSSGSSRSQHHREDIRASVDAKPPPHGKTMGRSASSQTFGSKGRSALSHTVGASAGRPQDTGVESFLTASGPRLPERFGHGSDRMSMAKIKQQRQRLRHKESGIGLGGVSRGSRPNQQGTMRRSSTTGEIDVQLLKAAMDYADRCAVHVDDDALADAEDDVTQPRAQQRSRRKSSGGRGRGRRSSSRTGRRRGQRSSFDFSVDGDPDAAPKFDMDALVQNFEQGTYLQELRKQLTESQRSLSESDNFIQKAASSWFSN